MLAASSTTRPCFWARLSGRITGCFSAHDEGVRRHARHAVLVHLSFHNNGEKVFDFYLRQRDGRIRGCDAYSGTASVNTIHGPWYTHWRRPLLWMHPWKSGARNWQALSNTRHLLALLSYQATTLRPSTHIQISTSS